MRKKSVKKTTEEFKNEVYNLVKDEYKVLSEYTGTNNKIIMLHVKCNNEYSVTPNKFLQGRRCPECSGKTKKDTKKFYKEVYDLTNGEYELKSEYIDAATYVNIEHKVCGEIINCMPKEFVKSKNPRRCICMSNRTRWTTQKLSNYIDETFNEEFTLLSEYINRKTQVTVLHNECGKTRKIRPENILRDGITCTCQKNTKGEQKIISYLLNKNIEHETQYKFDNLKNKFPLKFDFALYFDNKFLLIEYDGEFHFEDTSFNQKYKEKFLKGRKRDILKNEYCKKNKIKLIRIPYWEYNNIEQILDEVLINESSTTNSTIEKYWKKEMSYFII